MPDRRDELGAVILAGGRARRLGGADKPGIMVGEQTLVAAVATAAAGAGAEQLVLVGPARPELAGLLGREAAAAGPAGSAVLARPRPACTVEFTRERPPGAGPVPALAAGLRLARARWVLLLAADLPFLRSSQLRDLAAAAAAAAGGAVLTDDGGRPQWLTGCWPAAMLRTALAGYTGTSLGGLLGPLAPARVTPDDGLPDRQEPGPPPWLDCDTPEDLAAARRLARLQEGTR